MISWSISDAEHLAFLKVAENFPGAVVAVHVLDVGAAADRTDKPVETGIEQLPADCKTPETVPREKVKEHLETAGMGGE